MKRIALLSLLSIVSIFEAVGQPNQSPYAGEHTRTIKALSADEISSYLAGDGMGLAKAAELNHFPGPKHVLELAGELHLTDAQRLQTQQILDEMRTAAIDLGTQIVDREARLDSLFSSGIPAVGTLRETIQGIGTLQANLRFVHLNAHLALRATLTDTQVAQYDHLRGYAASGGRHHVHTNH